MTIRVWAEFISPQQIIDSGAVELFARHDAIPGIAIRPGGLTPELGSLLSRCMDAGVKTMLWPLLDDASGYWASERNASEFTDTVHQLCEWIDKQQLQFDWLAVDLEPPVYQMNQLRNTKFTGKIKTLAELYKSNKNPSRFKSASKIFNTLIEEMHQRKVKVLAAAPEIVIHDIRNKSTHIQDLLETPISSVNFDMVSFMIYTSMTTGYSKGIINRKDAARLLYLSLRDAHKYLGEKTGVSIGVNHTGKLEDEPFYSNPENLSPDVSAAKAAQISDISIFCLEGILKNSAHPDKWFETVKTAASAAPSFSLVSDPLHKSASVLSSLI